jgi:hypothetical protein
MLDNVRPELFWSKVDQSDPDACWLWQGKSRRGSRKQYGSYSVRVSRDQTKGYAAHRLAFMLDSGEPIPQGLLVMHRCDTPLCCNPAHLRLGTHADNVRDMWRKGRGSTGPRPGRFKKTITAEQEAEVVRLRRETKAPQKAIAAQVGISQMSVSNILRAAGLSGVAV